MSATGPRTPTARAADAAHEPPDADRPSRLVRSAPAAVLKATVAMGALLLGTLVAAKPTGIGAWRSAIPSRAIGAMLTVAGLLFLVPLRFGVTYERPDVAIIALVVTWMVLFGVVGIALRRR